MKTLVLWKVLHQMLPVEKDIQISGLSLCSMCSLCRKQEESLFHIFFIALSPPRFGIIPNRFFLSSLLFLLMILLIS